MGSVQNQMEHITQNITALRMITAWAPLTCMILDQSLKLKNCRQSALSEEVAAVAIALAMTSKTFRSLELVQQMHRVDGVDARVFQLPTSSTRPSWNRAACPRLLLWKICRQSALSKEVAEVAIALAMTLRSLEIVQQMHRVDLTSARVFQLPSPSWNSAACPRLMSEILLSKRNDDTLLLLDDFVTP